MVSFLRSDGPTRVAVGEFRAWHAAPDLAA